MGTSQLTLALAVLQTSSRVPQYSPPLVIALAAVLFVAVIFFLRKRRRTRAMNDLRTKLREAHHRLSNQIDGYRVYQRHGIPDFCLYHYALDVLEQTHAVFLLADSIAARSAISNARAANEAAFYMLALTSSEADYDQSGIYARACSLVEVEQLHVRRAKADAALGLSDEENGMSPEDIMEADGTVWESEKRDAKALCLQTLAEVRRDGRWKRHWTGDRGWKDVVTRVATAWNTAAGFIEMADALYGAESYHSHPRPRAGSRAMSQDAQGRFVAAPLESDKEVACGLALIACTLASAAIERRLTFSNAKDFA